MTWNYESWYLENGVYLADLTFVKANTYADI